MEPREGHGEWLDANLFRYTVGNDHVEILIDRQLELLAWTNEQINTRAERMARHTLDEWIRAGRPD